MLRPRKKLNPFQRLLVSRAFVYFTLLSVAVMGALGVVMPLVHLLGLWHPTEDTILTAESNTAVRLVAIGVFFELRGSMVSHLRGKEAAEADEPDLFLSESLEVYGGYLTVIGLFMEMGHGARELLHGTYLVTEIGTGVVVVLSALSLHVIYDLVRELRRGPHDEAEAVPGG